MFTHWASPSLQSANTWSRLPWRRVRGVVPPRRLWTGSPLTSTVIVQCQSAERQNRRWFGPGTRDHAAGPHGCVSQICSSAPNKQRRDKDRDQFLLASSTHLSNQRQIEPLGLIMHSKAHAPPLLCLLPWQPHAGEGVSIITCTAS